MKEKRNIKLWAVAVWLIVWEVAARLLNKEIFLVSPIKAILRFFELAVTGEFWFAVLSSFARIAIGFLLAVVIGLVFAALSAKHKKLRELLTPIMLAIKAVPIASFIILALICFSSKYLAVLISFMIVIPTVYENVLTGIEETDKSLLEMGEAFGLSQNKKLRYIYAPDIFPYFRAACKTAVGMAWKAGVAAEVIGIPRGSIGAMLNQAKIYLETADLLAWTIGVILLSLVMERAFIWGIERAFRQVRRLPAAASSARVESAALIRAEQAASPAAQASAATAGSSAAATLTTSDSSAAASPAAVELRGLSKSYGDNIVLNNVSFVFPAGETSAIMAPSGAGKTTALRIIACLETADSGEVACAPKITTTENGKPACAPKIATTENGKPACAPKTTTTENGKTACAPKIMFQEDRLLEYMTAEENIRLVSDSLTHDQIMHALSAVGLLDDGASIATKPVSEFSGGMKRRVALLRALLALNSADQTAPGNNQAAPSANQAAPGANQAAPGAVLLLDEPFKGLDDETKIKTIEFIKETARGATVILVTHDKDEAVELGAKHILNL